MSDDPLAPKLTGEMLDGIIREHRRRARTNGFTKHVAVPKKEPNRFCKVCTVVFHSDAILAGPEMKGGFCTSCQEELDKGQIAVIVPNTGKHCFVYSFTLAGHGPIIECSDEVFEKLKVEAEKQKQTPPPA